MHTIKNEDAHVQQNVTESFLGYGFKFKLAWCTKPGVDNRLDYFSHIQRISVFRFMVLMHTLYL